MLVTFKNSLNNMKTVTIEKIQQEIKSEYLVKPFR